MGIFIVIRLIFNIILCKVEKPSNESNKKAEAIYRSVMGGRIIYIHGVSAVQTSAAFANPEPHIQLFLVAGALLLNYDY